MQYIAIVFTCMHLTNIFIKFSTASAVDFAGLKDARVNFTAPGQTWCIWLFANIDSAIEGGENFILMVTGETGRFRNDILHLVVSVTDTGEDYVIVCECNIM